MSSSFTLYLLHESFYLVFCRRLFLFPGTGTSNILLSTCRSSLILTYLYDVSLFSVIYFVTGASFTDPLACPFVILSFFPIPHIHLSSLISFTSIIFYLIFVVDHDLSLPYTRMLAKPLFCKSSSIASRASFCQTTLHCTSSNFPNAALTLCLISISIPPISSPVLRYLELLLFHMVTVCRSTISSCSNLHSIHCVLGLPTLISSSVLNDSRYSLISTQNHLVCKHR